MADEALQCVIVDPAKFKGSSQELRGRRLDMVLIPYQKLTEFYDNRELQLLLSDVTNRVVFFADV